MSRVKGHGWGASSYHVMRSSITTGVEESLASPPQAPTKVLGGLALAKFLGSLVSASLHQLPHVPHLLSVSCLLNTEVSTSLVCVIETTIIVG